MRTRFIPRDLLDRYELVHWSPAGHGAEIRPAPIDVAAQMREMWG